jgi:gamma-glutamylcyclotransferase (GGCT)/AIG2-like uncharacterized protein YtfP
MENGLFVYGTLLPGRAPSEIADVVDALTPIGKGTILGRLYDFGDYPGVVLGDNANEKVQGEVFVLPSDPQVLARLDDYEEYHPQNPEGSLFKRLRTTVTLLNGSRESCWVYVYNRALPGISG